MLVPAPGGSWAGSWPPRPPRAGPWPPGVCWAGLKAPPPELVFGLLVPPALDSSLLVLFGLDSGLLAPLGVDADLLVPPGLDYGPPSASWAGFWSCRLLGQILGRPWTDPVRRSSYILCKRQRSNPELEHLLAPIGPSQGHMEELNLEPPDSFCRGGETKSAPAPPKK